MGGIKLLIVEDNILVAEDICSAIELVGFEVGKVVDNGADAIQYVAYSKPDLVIMDINIKGELDGIETAAQLKKNHGIPIIYLTDRSDIETYGRAKATKPHAFLSKPFTAPDLQRSIEQAIVKMYEELKGSKENLNLEEGAVLNKKYMLKDKEGLHSIDLGDIVYLKSDRQYCDLHTEHTKFKISKPMNKVLEGLLTSDYCQRNVTRIHKSYCINLENISSIKNNQVTIKSGNMTQTFAIGGEYREQLFDRFQTI